MGMDMKEPDSGIDDQARWKMLANTFEDVNDILAYDVINEENCLIILNVSVF